MELTRASLLSRVRNVSDEGAWREFEALYHDLLVRFCRRRGLQEADASDVVTFPTLNIEEGTGILLEPQREYRVYYALIDESTSAGNPRHDFSTALTVTADYEVRYGLEGRTDT